MIYISSSLHNICNPF